MIPKHPTTDAEAILYAHNLSNMFIDTVDEDGGWIAIKNQSRIDSGKPATIKESHYAAVPKNELEYILGHNKGWSVVEKN